VPASKRVPLIQAPTPLHRLDRISDDLGIDLWIKRDDLTGLALGGNKGRKLEYIMADVLANKAEVVVSCGAMQSNFVRQLGAACAIFGITCEAVVMALPYSLSAGKPQHGGLLPTSGNVFLDELLGVRLHKVEDAGWDVLYGAAEDLAERREREGKHVYRVPVGGSSPLGGYAYYAAAQELNTQGAPFDFIITSTSSGSTQAGLTYAFHNTKTKVIGIAADPEDVLVEDVLRVGSGLSGLLGVEALGEPHFDVRLDYAGEAYGVPSETGNVAIEILAKREGILLDPIYSGKAFAGLLEMVDELKGRVLFWHTGGVPALFAMGEAPW
jgi:D-cysteine desulfhydrase family pyridoxal phosphate-dependent enzyme